MRELQLGVRSESLRTLKRVDITVNTGESDTRESVGEPGHRPVSSR